jgi:predicted O-methyltransferase YrrM
MTAELHATNVSRESAVTDRRHSKELTDDDADRATLALMETLMNYRHQPIYNRLHSFGARQSMLHADVLQLAYHFARISRGAILEIGAFRGGATVAAAWGLREAGAGAMKKFITIEPGGPLRKHALGTRDILRTLKRNLKREAVAELVTVLDGRSADPRIIAAVNHALGQDRIGLLMIDADAGIKRDFDNFGSKLLDGCWVIIDDYGGPAENVKGAPTKAQVNELVAAGKLVPLGYYGYATWVGKWITSPPGQ